MRKLDNDQKGFTAVEGLLILIFLAVIGGVGYMVYHNHHKTKTASTTSSSSNKSTSSALPASTITDGPSSGWKTYTNNTDGFSFTFPDTALDPSGCQQSDTYYSGDSNQNLTGPETYRYTQGQVANTVISSGINYYVVPSYTFELDGGQSTTIDGISGYDVFSSCQKVNVDTGLISQQTATEAQINGSTSLEFANLNVQAQIVSQGTPLNQAVETALGDNSLKVSKLTPTGKNGADKLSYTCAKSPCGAIGAGYSLLYYPSKNLLVFWNLGQGCNLLANSSANSPCYDSQISGSFKLTD